MPANGPSPQVTRSVGHGPLGAQTGVEEGEGTLLFLGGVVPHCLVNTEIRFIIFFAAKDGEALYSQ